MHWLLLIIHPPNRCEISILCSSIIQQRNGLSSWNIRHKFMHDVNKKREHIKQGVERSPDVPVGPVAVGSARPGPVRWRLGNRGCTSDRSIPSGSPVALLASLSYLDGDGVDEPEMEQNNSRLRAATHEAASPQLCPWPVIVQTGCQTHTYVWVKSASTHSKRDRAHRQSHARTHSFLSPLSFTRAQTRAIAPHRTAHLNSW